MSDLYRYSGEVAYSDEMLERCLYALETAWHPTFNPAAAACQLDYADEKNRPMFTALFRHMMVSNTTIRAFACLFMKQLLP